MNIIKSLCLFCGASSGANPEYKLAAQHFGVTLAQKNIRMIYGGGSVGLMGVAADACLANGGEVIGVIPKLLMEKEVGHHGISKMHVVTTMHERKALMTELSDGFIALPGGFGTMDELFESLTWQQLGYHFKPIGLLNVSGFYNGLMQFLDHARDSKLLRDMHRDSLKVDTDLSALIEKMRYAEMPDNDKWLSLAKMVQ